MYIALIAASLYIMSVFVSTPVSTSAFSASTTVATKPKLILKPTTVGTDKNVRVKGVRFTPNSLVTVKMGTTTLGTNTTDVSGTFTLKIKSPSTTGQYTITATDAAKKTASAILLVTASSTIAKISETTKDQYGTHMHIVGAMVNLTGTGFTPGDTVTIYFFGSPITTTTSNSTGGFSNTIFTIPTIPGGSNYINATDGTKKADIPYKIVGHVTSSLSSVAPGQTVTISGTGFGNSATVSFTFNGASIASPTTASSSGTFSAQVTIPSGTTKGNYPLVATDNDGNSGTVHIKVL